MSTATLTTSVTLPTSIANGVGPIAWSPAPERQLTWRDYAGPSARGRGNVPLPLIWPRHPVGAVLDYALLFSEPIASIALATSPSDLLAYAAFPIGPLVAFWLGGGTAGQSYSVAGTVNTVAGRIIPFSGQITCQEMPFAPAAPNPAPSLPSVAPTDLMQFFAIIGGQLVLNLAALPTSPIGLRPGAIWNNGGTFAFV